MLVMYILAVTAVILLAIGSINAALAIRYHETNKGLSQTFGTGLVVCIICFILLFVYSVRQAEIIDKEAKSEMRK